MSWRGRSRPLAAAALSTAVASLAASCSPDNLYGFFAAEGVQRHVDQTTWTATLSADLTIGIDLPHEDGHAALDAVRVVDEDIDPMSFEVVVTAAKENWPLVGFGTEGVTIHVDATASVPEGRKQDCIPSSPLLVEIDLRTDYGLETISDYLYIDGNGTTGGCW